MAVTLGSLRMSLEPFQPRSAPRGPWTRRTAGTPAPTGLVAGEEREEGGGGGGGGGGGVGGLGNQFYNGNSEKARYKICSHKICILCSTHCVNDHFIEQVDW